MNFYTRLSMLAMLFSLSFSICAKPLTLKQQLEQVNLYWKGKSDHSALLQRCSAPLPEVPLLQLHLSLVEASLRQKDVSHLGAQQQKNRGKCLDILHTYMLSGVFPKNLYHKERTPYFIDKYGTACAVGHIMIQTGQKELAEKISRENNYGYLADLKEQYPAIMNWGKENGFTADELAWIQPYYGCVNVCSTGTQKNVSCHGYNDGCASPDPAADGHPAPYTIQGYSWDGSQWQPLYYGLCDLLAGYYKAEVTDGLGMVHAYYYTITEPPPIAEITATNVSCDEYNDGKMTITATGGTPPYTYSWYPVSSTSSTITGLSPGIYYGFVTDSMGCSYSNIDTVFNPAPLSGSFTSWPDMGNCSGSISVTPGGGTPPYTYLWSPGGETDSLIAACAGSYTVTITDNNQCIATLSDSVDALTGISKIEQGSIIITPNPSNDLVYVILPAPVMQATVSLYNSPGQLVYEKKISNPATGIQLHVGTLPAGLYSITVNIGKDIWSGRLIRQ